MKLFGKGEGKGNEIDEMWKRRADRMVVEVKDMCRKIGNGEVAIPSDDLYFMLDVIRQNVDFVSIVSDRGNN